MTQKLWTAAERTELFRLQTQGATYDELAKRFDRSRDSIKHQLSTRVRIGPAKFADRCREIVATMKGHKAHHALDLLTNEVLREQGFGDGIAIFEASVRDWHREAHPYPHAGPCPNCEAA